MLFEVKLDGLACRPWDVQQKVHRVSSASGQMHFPLPPRCRRGKPHPVNQHGKII
jgi:hypothetical protein